ncbi:TetR-like C-terminal domain-containing protein [Streptomyces sp. NPDC001276]|uniref:TetR-like C-terminal domain-containing protein n=1 Tax=Streptomyces sp. NPDC001276 TaxID=3364555 RepID=UPI0036B68CD7
MHGLGRLPPGQPGTVGRADTRRPGLEHLPPGPLTGTTRAQLAAHRCDQLWSGLARSYLDFAARNPAVYDAMFEFDGGLAFANEDTPEPLKDAFAALLESLGEVSGDGVHPALFTEVFWAALHGLAPLARAGRLPPEDTEPREELLVDRLAMV